MLRGHPFCPISSQFPWEHWSQTVMLDSLCLDWLCVSFHETRGQTHLVPPVNFLLTVLNLIYRWCLKAVVKRARDVAQWQSTCLTYVSPRYYPNTHTHTHAYTCRHTHTCTYTHACAHICTCTHAHMHACAHTCTHTHIHTHMHAHAQTHIHTYTNLSETCGRPSDNSSLYSPCPP